MAPVHLHFGFVLCLLPCLVQGLSPSAASHGGQTQGSNVRQATAPWDILCEERVKWSSSISRPSRRRRELMLMSRTRPRARSLLRAGVCSLVLSRPIIYSSCSCSFPHSTPPQATSAAKCSQASSISQNETAYGVTAASLASFDLIRARSWPLYELAG